MHVAKSYCIRQEDQGGFEKFYINDFIGKFTANSTIEFF